MLSEYLLEIILENPFCDESLTIAFKAKAIVREFLSSIEIEDRNINLITENEILCYLAQLLGEYITARFGGDVLN